MKREIAICGAVALAGFVVGAISAGDRSEAQRPVLASPATPTVASGKAAAPSASTAVNVALQTCISIASLQDLAACRDALERLDAAEVAALLTRLQRTPAQNFEAEELASLLFKWWSKRDPKAVSAWITPQLMACTEQGPTGAGFVSERQSQLFRDWADDNPIAAMEFARQHAGTSVANILFSQAFYAWPETDRATRFAFLQQFPAGHVPWLEVQGLLDKWFKDDPKQALRKAGELTDANQRAAAIDSMFWSWPSEETKEALTQYEALGLSDPPLYAHLICNLATVDPERALELLNELDPAQFSLTARHFAVVWVAKDPISALNWAAENGVDIGQQSGLAGIPGPMTADLMEREYNRSTIYGVTSDQFSPSPLNNALSSDRQATLAWLQGLPPGDDRDRLTELTVASGKLDRDQALQLFASLPPEAAARLSGGLAQLFFEDPDGGKPWAASLPEGPIRQNAWREIGHHLGGEPDLPPGKDRDAFLAGAVQADGQMSSKQLSTPAPLLDMALAISDPALRQDALEDAMETYGDSWPKEVGDWLDRSALPAPLKARLHLQLTQVQARSRRF